MLGRVISAGHLLLILEMCQYAQGHTIYDKKSLQPGDLLTLLSPGFPTCCLKNFDIILNCSSSHCAFKITFLDVDLPPSASLVVIGDPAGTSTELARAQYEPGGLWTRPSLIYKGTVNNPGLTVSISLSIPEQRLYPEYTGIKANISAYDPTLWQKYPDVTSIDVCGSTNLQTWKGGEIDVKSRNFDLDDPLYASQIDCIWLLPRPDKAASSVYAFIRITSTSLPEFVAVRNGTSSADSALFYSDWQYNSALEKNQGPEGFPSQNDLYVRIVKSNITGSFKFTYGLFERIFDGEGDYCTLSGQRGFHCEPSRWCIPLVDRCDGVTHCPKGEDEKDCAVIHNQETTTSSTTTPQPTKVVPSVHGLLPQPAVLSSFQRGPCPFDLWRCPDGSCKRSSECPEPTIPPPPCPPGFDRCPDGECIARQLICKKCPEGQKRCSDGNCVPKYTLCSGDCHVYEKRCEDGSCIWAHKRCPEDCQYQEKKCSNGDCIDARNYCLDEFCPRWHPHRCGHVCYGENDKCDGVPECDNIEDERDCGGPFPWYIPMLVVVLVLFIIIVLAVRYQTKRTAGLREDMLRASNSEPVALAGARATPTAGPIISGAQAVNTSTYPAYNATHADTTVRHPLNPSAGQPGLNPSAPPSYTEALDTTYYPAPSAPMLDPSTPPSYESVTKNQNI